MSGPRTIAIVYNDDFYLHRFKGGVIRALSAAGHRVHAIAPAGDAVEEIEEAGATFVDWPLARRGFGPWGEVRSILALRSIYRRIRPDIVHHFTAKPRVYGAIASRLSGSPTVIASINGLGYVYTENNLKSAVIRPAVSLLNRLAFAWSEAVLFQNRDDIAFFEARGLVSEHKVRYVPGGSGIDTSFFSPETVDGESGAVLKGMLDLPQEAPVVLLAGRMLIHKGVREFVKCAQAITERRPASFLLVGPVDPGNPASIPRKTLVEWEERGWVRYLGERSDIRELMAMADIVALPSYMEGLPRVLLEAAAMGRPMVATDVPGCREVVEDGVNGLLVPPRDPGALATAVGNLLDSPALRSEMGAAARRKAVAEFDEKRVVKGIMALYDELLSRKG